MRVVFMGNPKFGISTIECLIKSKHEIVGVVSNSPKRIGRRLELKYSEVGSFALKNKLPLIAQDDINTKKFGDRLEELNPDIFIVIGFKMLGEELLKISKYGAINLHPSLLPKYRGAAPIQWALINGDNLTGVSIFKMNTSLDTGDIFIKQEVPILKNDNFNSLSKKLSKIGSQLIIDTLNIIDGNNFKLIKQDSKLVSKAPKISKSMTKINWEWSAEKIHNLVRGLSYLGMRTQIKEKSIRIFKTSLIESNSNAPAGTVILRSKNKLLVASGQGVIGINELQADAKKKMPISEFLNGFNIRKGDLFC